MSNLPESKWDFDNFTLKLNSDPTDNDDLNWIPPPSENFYLFSFSAILLLIYNPKPNPAVFYEIF